MALLDRLKKVRPNAPVPKKFSTGLIPRNFRKEPVGAASFAPEFPSNELIDPSEWGDRLNEMRKTKSGLLELREAKYEVLRSLNQDGYGLCWGFSTAKAVMYLRALMNTTDLRLSAWYVCGRIKNWRDQGGWGFASLKFIVEQGIPAESYCPSYRRSYDTAETRANAALHKVTEWYDGSDDPRLAQQQLVSMLLNRVPCVVDLNVMGHSMCAIDLLSVNPVTVVYDNSWGEGSGEKGLYVGKGAYTTPNGLVIPRVTTPSTKQIRRLVRASR